MAGFGETISQRHKVQALSDEAREAVAGATRGPLPD